MYHFPATKFSRTNSPWRQWFHLLSEVIEVGFALLSGDLHHAAREVWDVRQSAESLHRILEAKKVNVMRAKEDVRCSCAARGYYE